MNSPEIIFNLVRLLKQNVSAYELINTFDYDSGSVQTALRIVAYLETCNKNKLRVSD